MFEAVAASAERCTHNQKKKNEWVWICWFCDMDEYSDITSNSCVLGRGNGLLSWLFVWSMFHKTLVQLWPVAWFRICSFILFFVSDTYVAVGMCLFVPGKKALVFLKKFMSEVFLIIPLRMILGVILKVVAPLQRFIVWISLTAESSEELPLSLLR